MRTTTIDLARDAYRVEDLLGRQAVFTTYDGERLVGTVLRGHGAEFWIAMPNGLHGVVPSAATLELVEEA